MRAHVWWLCLLLWGCDGRDLGVLIAPAPPLPPPVCQGEDCPPVCPDAGCPPPACDPSQPDLVCGQGICLRQVPACLQDEENVCLPGEPEVEACNDLDDNCDGQVDEGCDDDGDLYCDADMVVVGSPAICPKGGAGRLDCDDQDRGRHPGRTEICDDGVDNNCDGLADYLDFNGCLHITASFEDEDGIKIIEHGTAARVRAVLTPPTEELSRQWRVARATPDTHCRPEDVELLTPVETAESTQRQVRIVDDPTKLDCAYDLELLIDGIVADRLQVQMRNTRPIVSAIVGAVFDENVLLVTMAEGTTPPITATVPADDDPPVTLRWDGRDADLLACEAPCESDSVRFAVPPAVGTYELRVRAADSFDGVFRNRTVRVEVVPCTWVRVNGTGDGSGPALAQALPDIGSGVTVAANLQTNVCVAGAGTFAVTQALVLPGSVGILAGFNGAGAPLTNSATLRFSGQGQLSMAPGHDGRLARLNLRAGPASPMVGVVDASPFFDGVSFLLPAGEQQVGLRVQAVARAVDVRLRSSMVEFSGAQTDATGISVLAEGAPQATLRVNGGSEVLLPECRGACVGVRGQGHVDLRLSGRIIDVEAVGAGASAIAVRLESRAGRRPTADIAGYTRITARTQAADPAEVTVGVHLSQTTGVRIANNILVGPRTEVAGRRLSAGIADGEVFSDGRVLRGGSTELTIENNRRVAAGRFTSVWTEMGCDAANGSVDAALGTEIGAGILLVGTATAVVSGNGNNGVADNAVFGAASSAAWQAGPTRRLPPSVPALWTVDTRDVRVERNELRAGVLVDVPGCTPSPPPAAEVFRDGLGGNVQDSLPSYRLLIDANGIVTGRSGPLAAAPRIDGGATRGLAFSPGGSAVVSNNYVAITRGADLVGVYSQGAQDLELVNNTIEVDLLSPDPNLEVRARGLHLVSIEQDGLRLANTIVLIRDGGDTVSDPIALQLEGPNAAQGLGRFDSNLLFVEAAERDGRGAYVHIVGGARVGRAEFAAFESVIGGRQTLILPPLFQAHGLEHRRSISRLSEGSPAVDQGTPDGAPPLDRFGLPRPQGPGVDIGHHELAR